MAFPQDEKLQEFDLMRKQTQQRSLQNQQVANDAMKRRFAAQGGLNSGAFIKAQEVQGEKLRQEAEQANQGIDIAEAQERQRRKELGQQMDFQKEQFGLQKEQFGFQKDVALKDQSFKDKVFSFEKESKLKQLDLAERQFALDKDAQEFNKRLAMMEANKKDPGLLDSIGLGGSFGGILGDKGKGLDAVLPVASIANAPIVKNVGSAVKKFCFAAGTEFKMADGSLKPIEQIALGDEMKDGGRVYSINQSLNSGRAFNYGGSLVTGGHAVLEDGKWIRVENSRNAIPSTVLVPVVYTLSNEGHRMISAGGITFADYDEVDCSQGLDDINCLAILNSGSLASAR